MKSIARNIIANTKMCNDWDNPGTASGRLEGKLQIHQRAGMFLSSCRAVSQRSGGSAGYRAAAGTCAGGKEHTISQVRAAEQSGAWKKSWIARISSWLKQFPIGKLEGPEGWA